MFGFYLLLVVLPNLHELTGVLTCLLGLAILVLIFPIVMFRCDRPDEHELATVKFLERLHKLSMIVFAVCALTTAVTPDKKSMIQVGAVSMLSEIKGLSQIPDALVSKLTKLLSDTDESTPKKDKQNV